MRVVEQTLRQRVVDPNGISLDQNYVATDFIAFDGVLAITSPYNGVVSINLNKSQDGFLPSRIGFTTGLTGSVADVTIIGFDRYGRAQTEAVTMPGASGTIISVLEYGIITSMQIDGVATNLSVGILAADQFGEWVALDRNIPTFNVNYQAIETAGAAVVSLLHTQQRDLLRNGPDGVGEFADTGMAASALDVTDELVSLVPVVASRLRIDAASVAAVVLFRVNQTGHAN